MNPEVQSTVPGGRRRRYSQSLAALRGVQKPARGVSYYSTHVNRPAGRRLAATADALELTPNHVTLLSGLSSLSAVALIVLSPPTVALGVLAAAALVLGYALDSADGQLARLRGTGGALGEWFDHMVDCAVKVVLHAGVLVAWYRFTEREALLLLPLAFLVVAVLLFFGGTLVAKLIGQSPGQPRDRQPRRASQLLLLPVDSGIIAFTFLFWGWPSIFLALYALLLLAHVVVLPALCVSWARDLT